MARIAIFASGNGSNFESLVNSFSNDVENKVIILICDNANAFVLQRAKRLEIPFELIKYIKNEKEKTEQRISEILTENKIDVAFLAGYMRILSLFLLSKLKIPVINIHPSILPKFKGVNAIEQAFNSQEKEIGITIHYVIEEVDNGEIILQKSIPLQREKGIEFVEQEVHNLEHKWYPIVAKQICDGINFKNGVKR